MSKIAFGKTGPSTPVTEEQPSTAVATRETLPPPATSPFSDDNIPLSEITLPRLNIVQKVGELSNVFNEGSLVLSGEQVLYELPKDPKAEAPAPLTILCLGFQPMIFVEKLPGGTSGRRANSPEEVVSMGGTIDFNESKTGKPLFQRSRTGLFLIEKPANVDDTNFPHERDGKKYCTALWTTKASGYTNGAKVFQTAKQIGCLRGPDGYRTAFYTLGTARKQTDGNFYYVPVLRPGAKTTEEFRNWIKTEVVGF
jgi:hypothetical protein